MPERTYARKSTTSELNLHFACLEFSGSCMTRYSAYLFSRQSAHNLKIERNTNTSSFDHPSYNKQSFKRNNRTIHNHVYYQRQLCRTRAITHGGGNPHEKVRRNENHLSEDQDYFPFTPNLTTAFHYIITQTPKRATIVRLRTKSPRSRDSKHQCTPAKRSYCQANSRD